MSPDDLPALTQALDLIHAPSALEVLHALAEDSDPYQVADEATVTAAITMLRELGAATATVRPDGRYDAVATEPGRAFFGRLVEIENGTNLKPR